MELFNHKKLKKLFNSRPGEACIGDTIELAKDSLESSLDQSQAQFVIIGIPEDIGPRANGGSKGCAHAFDLFIKSFLKIQNNQFLDASKVLLLGAVDCFDLIQESHKVERNEQTDIETLKALVEELDRRVMEVLIPVFKSGKTPIIIGGGHNNVYPIHKAFQAVYGQGLHCINFDAHADLRRAEGRHSGNGFSYALLEGALDRYFVLGLQESYNNQYILDQFKNSESLGYLSFEDIIYQDLKNLDILNEVHRHFNGSQALGIEIDVDCMANVPSSAQSPVGFSERRVLGLLHGLLQNYKSHYLHISEASASDNYQTGKLIASFVTTYLKA